MIKKDCFQCRQKSFMRFMFFYLILPLFIASVLFPLSAVFPTPVQAQLGVDWTEQDSGTTNRLNDIAWSGNRLTVVGDSGTILTSLDGATWTDQSWGSKDLYGVTWRRVKPFKLECVAVGDNGTILTSPDGKTWTARNSDIAYQLNDIIWGNSTYVAVGNSGTILTSPDGKNWTGQDSGTDRNLNGITWVGPDTSMLFPDPRPGHFVAVGDTGTILASKSGKSWVDMSSGSRDLYSVTFRRDRLMLGSSWKYVVVGHTGTILTSKDVLTHKSPLVTTWTGRDSHTALRILDVAHNSNQFIAVGASGTIRTSPKGITWTVQSSDTDNHLRGVTWGFGINKFVAVGSAGTILTSEVSESVTQPLGNLQIGDKVVDPSWDWEFRTDGDYTFQDDDEKKPVTWIVVAINHYGPGSGITLLSEELIGKYAFDNSTNVHEDGYNRWEDSGTHSSADRGLRPWLNSTGIHEDEGFYHAFSEDFKSGIITTNVPNKVWNTGVDYETTDKVFIPSTTEMGDEEHNYTYDIGSVYPYFHGAENAKRIAQLGAIDTRYWTRSPSISQPCFLRRVSLSGGFVSFWTNRSHTGIRPVLNMKPETLVTEDTNSDNAYEIVWPEPPAVVSAETNLAGDVITIAFDKEMAHPAEKHDQFEFNDGEVRTFSAAVLNTDPTKIDLTVEGTAITHDAIVSVSYTAGDVTAADGSELETFAFDVINIVPVPGSDANLSNLEVDPGELDPDFTPDETNYIVDVGHNVETVEVTATLSDTSATMTINTTPVNNDEALTITLEAPGMATEIEIEVTAEDLTTEKIYTVTVNRAAAPGQVTTLYWQNTQSGLRYLWFMDGLTLVERGGIGTFGAGVWNIVGVGELGGDGKTTLSGTIPFRGCFTTG